MFFKKIINEMKKIDYKETFKFTMLISIKFRKYKSKNLFIFKFNI